MFRQWRNQCTKELGDLHTTSRKACLIWKNSVLQYREKIIREKELTLPLPRHSTGF